MFLTNDETRPAGMAISRMGLKAISALMEVLRRGSPDVRWSVAQVLGGFAQECGDQRSIELLRVGANDPDPMVRENADYWLEEIGKAERNTS